MKPPEYIQSNINIAVKHTERLNYAIEKLKHKFPISGPQINQLTNLEIETFELFTSRFAKLQDFLGAKLYPLFLELSGEDPKKLTFIDLINRLEQLGIIENATEWKLIRITRNHISHEYPDNPEILAEHLNTAFAFVPKLINYSYKIINAISALI